MADPTAVNDETADAVAQASVGALGLAPAQAVASLYQIASHSTGLALQNAVANQQQLNQINTAVVSQAVNLIMSIGSKS